MQRVLRRSRPPCLLNARPSLQGGARKRSLVEAPRSRSSVTSRFAAQRSLTLSSTQRENHLRRLNGDETSGTAFERGSMEVLSVNVQPNSFIMKIVPAGFLPLDGRTSLLVSHRDHSRPLTAPPQSVHAGRFTSPRAGACFISGALGVNCLASLSRASSRGQKRA